ncbi:sensor histidine kinase [Paenibacillus sp. GD4]|uniref:sensor histidine kinase n=1 Tax=Paenibacillus sp. GD4 TaxID=3068890 RepID=UPI0027966842|nr:sensor histidine kinase [Paenibacillus sp. GD4]MDQ1912763.1 sensor histidine kinase [Paenibacillus sp. GD4]
MREVFRGPLSNVKGEKNVNGQVLPMDRIVQIVKRCAHHILLRDHPLVVKLLIYSGLLVMIPMLVVGLISYTRSSEVLEREAQQSSWQIIEQVKMHVEHYVRDFEITTLKMINHPDMREFLSMQTQEEIEQSGIRGSVQEILMNAAYSRGDISGITLLIDNLRIIDTSSLQNAVPAEEMRKEYWYEAVPLTGEPMLVSRFIRQQDRQEPVITIAKRIFSSTTLKPIGMIVIDVNFKRIQEIAQVVTIGRTGFMSILDSKGHYVFHPDVQQLGQKSNYSEWLTADSGSLAMGQDRRELLTYSRSSELGWTLLTVVPYKELTQGVNHIGQTILWTTILTLLAAYLIGAAFTASIIRPIRDLHRSMRKIEMGDFDTKTVIESNDELGMLAKGFNKMVERLKELLDEIYFTRLKETEMSLRQKDTELRVLQAQINPHFLYNALETIRGMALDKDADDIALMSSALSKLFRYNLKEASQTTDLRQELEVSQLYLRIQKFRFESRLEYGFRLPEWAERQSIVRFSLQPILENCMNYAMDPSTGMTRITITAEKEGEETFLLHVRDEGPGIAEDRLETIRFDLDHRDLMLDCSHIGLVNVHRRTKYLFGEGCGIMLDSKEGQGTCVTIRLPFRNGTE